MRSMFRFLFCAAAIGAAGTLPMVAAQGPHGPHHRKLSKDAEREISAASVPVIITYKHSPTAFNRNTLTSKHGQVKQVFSYLPLIAANVPGSVLRSIASNPEVSYVSIDHKVHSRSAEYTTVPINAPAVWAQNYDGAGIGVAVVDSGVSSQVDDLGKGKHSRVVFSASFVPSEQTTEDGYGHGTHVAGLIAGDGTDSSGHQVYRTFRGIAPGANIINLKALDSNGQGTDSSVIAAIEAAIVLKPYYNIRVLNLSLGRPIFESYQQDPLCQAVELAEKAGILVVVAAGNDGRNLNLNPEAYGTIEAPGNDPYVLTVGAMKTNATPAIGDDTIASYSSKGPSFIDHIAKPDLVAPGNLVPSLKATNSLLANEDPFSTLYSEYMSEGPGHGHGNGNDHGDGPACIAAAAAISREYLPLSGTSMAAAVTSGAAALLLQADPQLTPAQAKAVLMLSANKNEFPLTSQVVADGHIYKANYDVFTVGAGYLDISAALNYVNHAQGALPSGDAISPVAVYDPVSNATYLQSTPGSLVGSTILWGSNDIYGAQAFTGQVAGSTILWGSNAVAGASDPSGFSALWATSGVGANTILWGSSSAQAETILWGSSGDAASTILWGSRNAARTILWGSSVPFEQ